MSDTTTVEVVSGPDATTITVTDGEATVVTVQDTATTVVAAAAVGPRGPQGPPGPPGDSASYVHAQSTPLAVWTVQHGLGYQPGGITVLDADGDLVLGWTATQASTAVLVLTFPVPVSGTAYVS